jgi:hypothetical protein
MKRGKKEAPCLGRSDGAGDIPSANRRTSISGFLGLGERRRLPAFGRDIRAKLLAGKRPRVGGGCVCIATDWKIRTALAQMVCESGLPIESWDLTFLAGVEVLLLTHAPDVAYAEALADALTVAGSPLVSLHVVAEADRGR